MVNKPKENTQGIAFPQNAGMTIFSPNVYHLNLVRIGDFITYSNGVAVSTNTSDLNWSDPNSPPISIGGGFRNI